MDVLKRLLTPTRPRLASRSGKATHMTGSCHVIRPLSFHVAWIPSRHAALAHTPPLGRHGSWFNHHPHAMDPTFMAYSMDEPPAIETCGEGLAVFHNPSCKTPLDRKFFVDAVQGYIEDGKFVVEYDTWHPMVTQTWTLHLGTTKGEMSELPWRQAPRTAVGAIAKEGYDRLCPHFPAAANPLAEQHGWFYDETGSFIGVVFRDKAGNQWGWVMLARDERFVFRCIEVDSSLSSRDEARVTVQLKIAQLLTSPRRIFATGHPGGQ